MPEARDALGCGPLTLMCQSVCGEMLPGVRAVFFGLPTVSYMVRVCLLGSGISLLKLMHPPEIDAKCIVILLLLL